MNDNNKIAESDADNSSPFPNFRSESVTSDLSISGKNIVLESQSNNRRSTVNFSVPSRIQISSCHTESDISTSPENQNYTNSEDKTNEDINMIDSLHVDYNNNSRRSSINNSESSYFDSADVKSSLENFYRDFWSFCFYIYFFSWYTGCMCHSHYYFFHARFYLFE